MIGRIILALMLVPLAAQAAETSAATPRRERPNIVYIFSDDHASHAISAYGSRINRTPNIDRLADQGMRFDNCFVANSICCPSRATILTGTHSHINGVFNINGPWNRADYFDFNQPTFPELMQRAGYQMAIVGKWHLGHGNDSDPRGFDYWNVLIDQGPYYNPPMIEMSRRVQHTGYTTDIITDISLRWLKEQRDADRPFMLMVQHKAPHREWVPGPKHFELYKDEQIPEPPTLFDDYATRTTAAREQEMTIARHMNDHDLQLVPPGYLNEEQLALWHAAYDEENAAYRAANLRGADDTRWKYQRYIKNYLRCVAAVDDNVGRILQYLDDAGLAENTVVIYNSDQGFFLGDHGWYDKRFMYEQSLRMPLLVRWPDRIKPGSVSDELVQNLDFAQTFLELAGVTDVPSRMQGRSLLPLMLGEGSEDWRDAIYYHYYDFPAIHMVRPMLGVRTRRHKLISFYTTSEWELYDLQRDPLELNNVYDDPAYAEARQALMRRLGELQEQYGDVEPALSPRELRRRGLVQPARNAPLRLVLQADAAVSNGLPDLDPSGRPITVGAICTPIAGDGVVISHGGEQLGYSLYLQDGRPNFAVRVAGQLHQVSVPEPLPLHHPTHLAAAIHHNGTLALYVNGQLAASGPGRLLTHRPQEQLCIGADPQTPVGPYPSPAPFPGQLRDIRLYWGTLDPSALARWTEALE